MSTIFKVRFGEDTRRVSLDRDPSYTELKKLAINFFKLSENAFQIKYFDDEGDAITIASDAELKEAFNSSKKNLEILKLFIFEVAPPPTTTTTSTTSTNTTPTNATQPTCPGYNNLLESILSNSTVNPFVGVFNPNNTNNNNNNTQESIKTDINSLVGSMGIQPWIHDMVQSTLLNMYKKPQTNENNTCTNNNNENNNNNNNNEETKEEAKVEHIGVSCDGCGMSPLLGNRFKCTICPNYDLCEGCEKQGDVIHPSVHPLIKISTPTPIECSWKGARRCPRPRHNARFVSDITIPDGAIVAPNTQFTKIWRLANEGKDSWPENCTLTYMQGDRLSDYKDVTVPSVLPGETIDVAVLLNSPSKPGRYTSYWRLTTPEGMGFGQKIWVDIFVVAEDKPNVEVVQTPTTPVIQQQQQEEVIKQEPEQPKPFEFNIQPNVPSFAQVPIDLIQPIQQQQQVQQPVQQEQPPVYPTAVEVPYVEEIQQVQQPVQQEQQPVQQEQQPIIGETEKPFDPIEEAKRKCITTLVAMGFGSVPNIVDIIKRFNFNINEIVEHIIEQGH